VAAAGLARPTLGGVEGVAIRGLIEILPASGALKAV
jgi:hypothetical protein